METWQEIGNKVEIDGAKQAVVTHGGGGIAYRIGDLRVSVKLGI